MRYFHCLLSPYKLKVWSSTKNSRSVSQWSMWFVLIKIPDDVYWTNRLLRQRKKSVVEQWPNLINHSTRLSWYCRRVNTYVTALYQRLCFSWQIKQMLLNFLFLSVLFSCSRMAVWYDFSAPPIQYSSNVAVHFNVNKCRILKKSQAL